MRLSMNAEKRPFKSVMFIALIILSILVIRLFELQLLKGLYYKELSTDNHIRSVMIPAPRGIITDRNGVVLADNTPAFNVSLVFAEFDIANSERLAELLEMDKELVEERIQFAASTPYKSIEIKIGLSVEEAGRVADNLYLLGGVSVEVRPQRRYPYGASFCHLIGYVGLADSTRNFEGELSGRSGLERILNEELAGKYGYIREVVDAFGRIVEEVPGEEEQPIPGARFELTIDSRLQLFADSLIMQTGRPGAFVAINYETGELLVLSSVPGYDTNLFVGGISAENWSQILNNPFKPLLNRSWATAYPPGSTYKTVTASWLLESGIVDENTMPDPCYRSFHFAGSDFICWGTHGRLNIVGALAQSCDTYFYRTSMLGDMDEFAEFSSGYGMGAKTTDFLPGEAVGALPTRELLNSIFGQGGWGLGNLMIASIGQGEVLATPLQVALTSALIASGGEMPHLALFKSSIGTKRHWSINTSLETLETVREGMRQAVSNSHGTLHRTLGYLPIQVYAKSGTAENGNNEDHAWVTGYIEEPLPIAFAVIIENGGSGGSVAGPVVADFIEKVVTYETQ